MNLLCFDPGKTTGIAIIQSGEWVMGLTVPEEKMNETLFHSLIRLAEPTIVVVEALPPLVSHQPTQAVAAMVRRWFKTAGYPIEEVNPGQWKGMVDRVAISGTHQVDAATMGAWYYRSRLVNLFNG